MREKFKFDTKVVKGINTQIGMQYYVSKSVLISYRKMHKCV